MASVSSFNDMLEQFINELKETFPEDKTFKKFSVTFDIMRKANPRKCVDSFMKNVSPYSGKIMTKDESVFGDLDLDIDIKKYWNGDLSQTTKNAIWQYLQMLNVLGMTITTIPPEMLSMVEGMASKCAESMTGSGSANTGDMLSGLFSMLGNSNNKLE